MSAWLVPVTGPETRTIALSCDPPGALIGRHDHCDVKLAADSVSRNHARVTFDGSRWRVTDLKSRWGTLVNGAKIVPEREVPLGDGDLIGINPWTFRFCLARSDPSGLLDRAMQLADDSAEVASAVFNVTTDKLPSLGDELLLLLLDSAATIHQAADEPALAQTLLDKACQGSGLPNAAVLKPADGAGRFVVVASRSAAGAGPIAFSRSLLKAAEGGEVAELSSERQNVDISQSMVSLGLRSALCVPLMLGQTVAAFLYLDSRGGRFGVSPSLAAARIGVLPGAGTNGGTGAVEPQTS